MEQTFSIEKQDFSIIKEKIIKTNELLVLYNEKNEKLARATQAFKQLKSKYETTVHDTNLEINRLKLDNERLNYSLETLKPKYEQNEKDLLEIQADCARVGEKYQQNMIESQLTISELEEKVKNCTCGKEPFLSPKDRSQHEKIKELKQICKKLKEVENNLKNENHDLVQQNKEFKDEKMKNMKLIQDFATKNTDLQRELAAIKDKVQKMELVSKEQANVQQTIRSLEQNHEREIHSLKMEIARLTFDNQKIKYLELECNKLKQQINSSSNSNKIIKTKRIDCCIQTEDILGRDISSLDDSTNVKKVIILEQECQELKKKLAYLERNAISKENSASNMKTIEPRSTLKVCDNESSDIDSVDDILSEMMVPLILSPFDSCSRSAESPTPPFVRVLEPLPPLEEDSSQQEPTVQKLIPNIVITPPTPNIGKGSGSNVIFLLPNNNAEEAHKEDSDEAVNEEVISINKTRPPKSENLKSNNEIKNSACEKSVPIVKNIHTQKSLASSTESLSLTSDIKKKTHKEILLNHILATNLEDSAIKGSQDHLNRMKDFSHENESTSGDIDPTITVANENEKGSLGTSGDISPIKTLFTSPHKKITTKNLDTAVKEIVLSEDQANSEKSEMLELATPVVTHENLSNKIKDSSCKKISPMKNTNLVNIVTDENLSVEHSLEKQILLREKNSSSAINNIVSTCDKSVSTEENSGKLYQSCVSVKGTSRSGKFSQKEFWKGKPKRRRKYWIPYNMNAPIKFRNKRRLKKPSRVTKSYGEFLSCQPLKRDTILDALKTLQQNNINFTISNESIPLVEPYAHYSIVTPPKTEPDPIRSFKKTFSYTLDCWNKKCTENHSQMLLRNVQNQEEPELLGFFSVKDEIITPAVSRMALPEKPKPLDAENLVTQLLNGIKDLIDIKHKELSGNTKKKRSKSKNKPSDFYSETETELEKLFRKSSDVLGRNRKLLAAAKGQSFDSNEESTFESESEMMVDSGLVSGTPKTDIDSLSLGSQNEKDESVVSAIFSPIIKSGRNTSEDDNNFQIQSEEKSAQWKNQSFAGFPLPNCSSKTPNFPKIRSTTPENLQISGTPLKTALSNNNSESSHEFFKVPFCPVMMSPMNSLKGSPVSRTSKATIINDIGEDSMDSFKMPVCPVMVSPLAQSIKGSPENYHQEPKVTYNSNITEKFFPVKADNIFDNTDQTSKKHPLIKTKGQIEGHNKDCFDIKSSFNGNISSLLCQKLTFDSVENIGSLDQGFHKLVSSSDSFKNENIKTSKSVRKTCENTNVVTVFSPEKTELNQTEKNNLSNISGESDLRVDLSINSSDLNYSLDDISISQLEVNSVMHDDHNEQGEKLISQIPLAKNNFLNSKNAAKELKTRTHNENADSVNVERRYSLRRKSQCTAKNDNNCDLDTQKKLSSLAKNIVHSISPRIRSSKRKSNDGLKDKQRNDSNSLNKTSDLREPEESAESLKKKRGRPRKVAKICVTSEDNDLSDVEVMFNSPGKKSSQNANILTRNQAENVGNVGGVVRNHLFGLESEGESDEKTVHQNTDQLSEHSEKKYLSHGEINVKLNKISSVQEMAKASIANNIIKSRISNKDSGQGLFNINSDVHDDVPHKNNNENFEHKTQTPIKNEDPDEFITKQFGPDKEKKKTLPKGSSKKNISKEFISESESDGDNAAENLAGDQITTSEMPLLPTITTNPKASMMNQNDLHDFKRKYHVVTESNSETEQDFFRWYISENKDGQSSKSMYHGSALENKKSRKDALFDKDKVKTNIVTLELDSDTNCSIKSNYSSIQDTTLEIQNMLRTIPEELGRPRTTTSSNSIDNSQEIELSEASHWLEKDLFGDISEEEISQCSEEDHKKEKAPLKAVPKKNSKRQQLSDASRSIEKDIFGDMSEEKISRRSEEDFKKKNVPVKAVPKKKSKSQNLMKRMLGQVRGTVYAYSENRGVNSIKNSCIDKTVEHYSESTSVKNMGLDMYKDDKRINVVQDILISKGQTFNLLPKHDKNMSFSNSSSIGATENTTSPSPKLRRRSIRTGPKKRIKSEQNCSNNTPVDILSQVMQGMVKTGPKSHARKTISNNYSYPLSNQSGPQNLNSIGIINGGVLQKDNVEGKVTKPSRKENAEEEEEMEMTDLECPKSPDVMELPDRLPRLIPTEKPVKLQPSKVRFLMDKLMVFSNEAKMLDDVIKEFAFQDMEFIVEIIIAKLSKDYQDKADYLFPPSPPMTSTQRILLGFLVKLDRSTHPGIVDKFLSAAEQHLFNRNICNLETVQPLTRLYTAVCKLRYDLNRIRRFISEGYYFMADFAVPMFFTVLTMWPDVFPLKTDTSENLLAKIVVQISYLKECNNPGYNLLPLRDLLNKYFGYPTERWNCEDIFQEILVEYIRNPSIRLADYTLLLFLKNKPTKWVYQKIKENIIPLYERASDSNPNLKATLVILLANICCGFQKYEAYDWSVILEMDRWFRELDSDDIDPMIKRSIHLARGRLPRRCRVKKKNKSTKNKKTESNKSIDNLETFENNSEKTPSCLKENFTLPSIKQETSKNNNEISIASGTRNLKEDSKCTNSVANLDLRLDDSEQTKCKYQVEDFLNSLSHDEESDSLDSGTSDIEF